MTAVDEQMAAAPVRAASRVRIDIQGLRALAVTVVVAYHVGLPGFDAGFIGVDMFFVISGFLITRLLADELDRSGGIRLLEFWARRARRLLPAASVMVLAVLAVTMLTTSVLHWEEIATEGLATTTYWANMLFAHRSTDYFGADINASPLLHMWSLAVEEQFYLAWPLLLAGATWLASLGRSNARSVRLGVVAIVTLASFALSLKWTNEGSPFAFFSAVSRAWELGVGALLALTAPAIARASRPFIRVVAASTGALLLVAAMVVIDARTLFPGRAALLPVLGTALLLAAGIGGRSPSDRAFAPRIVQHVGAISYSWYLWHWPVLVLGGEWFRVHSVEGRSLLAAASLIPAVASYRFIERPVRQHRALLNPKRTFVAASLTVALVASCCALLFARTQQMERDPFLASVVAAQHDRPPLDAACASTDLDRLQPTCVVGDRSADTVVLLIGDSKAAQWIGALDEVGLARGLKVVTSVQGDCPAVGYGSIDELPSCAYRLRHLDDLITQVRPDLVVVSSSAGYVGALLDEHGDRVAADLQLEAWTQATQRLAEATRAAGVPLLDILDVPRFDRDPLDCLADHGPSPPCDASAPTAAARVAAEHAADRAGLEQGGHGLAFDPTPLVCSTTYCPLIHDGLIAYVDDGHLTMTFSRALADPIGQEVAAAMRAG